MLGYLGGSPTIRSHFGTVPMDFLMDDVECEGSEDSILDCHHSNSQKCDADGGAGVICSYNITLVGGATAREGNLFVNGQPVCDDHWNQADATVVCRSLGYSGGSPTIRSEFGDVPTYFFMDDVDCE